MEEINLYNKRCKVLNFLQKEKKHLINEKDTQFLITHYGSLLYPSLLFNQPEILTLPYYDPIQKQLYNLRTFPSKKLAFQQIDLDNKLNGLFHNPPKEEFIAHVISSNKQLQIMAIEAGEGSLQNLILQRMENCQYYFEREEELFYLFFRLFDLLSRFPKRNLYADDIRPENFIIRKIKKKQNIAKSQDSTTQTSQQQYQMEDDCYSLVYSGLENLKFNFEEESQKEWRDNLFSVNKDTHNIYRSELTRLLSVYYSIGRILQYTCLSSVYAKQRKFYEKLEYPSFESFLDFYFQKQNMAKANNLLRIYYPYYVMDLIQNLMSLNIAEVDMNKYVNSLRPKGSKFLYNIDMKKIKLQKKLEYFQFLEMQMKEKTKENVQKLLNFYWDFELEDIAKVKSDEIIESQCENWKYFNMNFSKFPFQSIISCIFRKKCNVLTKEQDVNKIILKIKYNLQEQKVRDYFTTILEDKESINDYQKLLFFIEIIFSGSQFKETIYQKEELTHLKNILNSYNNNIQEEYKGVLDLICESMDFFACKDLDKQFSDYENLIDRIKEQIKKKEEDFNEFCQKFDQNQSASSQENLDNPEENDEDEDEKIQEDMDELTASELQEQRLREEQAKEAKTKKDYEDLQEYHKEKSEKFLVLRVLSLNLLYLQIQYQGFLSDILSLLVKRPDNAFLQTRLSQQFKIKDVETLLQDSDKFMENMLEKNKNLLENCLQLCQNSFVSCLQMNKNTIYVLLQQGDHSMFQFEIQGDKASDLSKELLQQGYEKYEEAENEAQNLCHQNIEHIFEILYKKLGQTAYMQNNFQKSTFWDNIALENNVKQLTDLSQRNIQTNQELFYALHYLRTEYRDYCYRWKYSYKGQKGIDDGAQNENSENQKYFQRIICYLSYLNQVLKCIIQDSTNSSRNMLKVQIMEELVFISGLSAILNTPEDFKAQVPQIFKDLMEKESQEYQENETLLEIVETGKQEEWKTISEITPYTFKIFLIEKYVQGKGDLEKAIEYLEYTKQQYCEKQDIINELIMFEMQLLIHGTKNNTEDQDWEAVNQLIVKNGKLLINPSQVQLQAFELIKRVQKKESQQKRDLQQQKIEESQMKLQEEERKEQEQQLREKQKEEQEKLKQQEAELERQRDREQETRMETVQGGNDEQEMFMDKIDKQFDVLIKQQKERQVEKQKEEEQEKKKKEKLNQRKLEYQRQQTAKFNDYQEKKRKEKEEALKRSQSVCCNVF